MNKRDELAERYFGVIQRMVELKCEFCGKKMTEKREAYNELFASLSSHTNHIRRSCTLKNTHPILYFYFWI